MRRVFGAMPPPDLAWQMGKTAGSIRFVKEAERMLADPGAPLSAKQREALAERVKLLKDGQQQATTEEEASVERFIQQIL
jgi:hypothetical protein